MAFTRRQLGPVMQQWLEKVAEEARDKIYGAAGCPEWGTKFGEIESDGMSVGLELARLIMQQSVAEQAGQMPPDAGQVPGDVVAPAGTETASLETEAGEVTWNEPRTRLQRGRKAFFPPTESAGVGGR